MFLIFLTITAALMAPTAYGSLGIQSGFSNDPQAKLIRPYIYENTTTHIFANVGDSVQFECYASGTTGANILIEWKRPRYGSPFLPSMPQSASSLLLPNGAEVYSGNILKFPSVVPEQAGSYECNAYEEHTLPSSQSYILSIKSMPFIRQISIVKTFLEKDVVNSIQLSTDSSAVPRGETTWYKDGQVLNHSDKYQVVNNPSYYSDGTSYVIISTENNDDYHGTYKFVARNELGENEYTFQI